MTWRRGFILICFVLVIIAIAARLIYVHHLDSAFLKQQGEVRSDRAVVLQAKRGLIKDRHGQVLAATTKMGAIAVDPSELNTGSKQWQHLLFLLDLSPSETAQKLAKFSQRRFMYLKRQVHPDIAEQIAKMRLPGVIVMTEYKRFYPLAEVTAPVLGFTNVDNQGIEGLELGYEKWLGGDNGEERYTKDLKGRVIKSAHQPAVDGRDVTLTIDARIQSMTYKALKAAVTKHRALAGTAVVLDVKTGEVLAMASVPSFNPNNFATIKPGTTRNRVVTDVYEPGSLLKTFAMASVLASGEYAPDDIVNTYPGRFRIGRRVVRDARNLGELSLTDVIRHSSNVGISKLVLDIEPAAFPDTLSALGFGRSTLVGFPGEQSGLMPIRRDWKPFALATLSFGYGISATTLQIAQAYAVIANGGKSISPTLIKGSQVAPVTEVLTPAVAHQTLEMLKTVVANGGTAIQAQVKGYEIAGKTGTARKAIPGGYAENQYVTSFAGIAPANDPKYAMVIMVDDPKGDQYYGGQVAAPVFASVMRRLLPMN